MDKHVLFVNTVLRIRTSAFSLGVCFPCLFSSGIWVFEGHLGDFLHPRDCDVSDEVRGEMEPIFEQIIDIWIYDF